VWFVSRPVTWLNIALAILTVALSGFSSNELMPQWLQRHVLEPYHLKALPSLLVWMKLQRELWSIPTPQCNRDCQPTEFATPLPWAA